MQCSSVSAGRSMGGGGSASAGRSMGGGQQPKGPQTGGKGEKSVNLIKFDNFLIFHQNGVGCI